MDEIRLNGRKPKKFQKNDDINLFLQQLLYHVLQITPKRNGGVLKRTKLKTNAAEQSAKVVLSTNESIPHLCPDSFQESVKNWTANKSSFAGNLEISLTNGDLFESSILLKPRKVVPPPKFNPLRVSYIAPKSFNDVRGRVLEMPFAVQYRCFKTERSIDAEMKRNPTMTTRLRDALSKNYAGLKNHMDLTCTVSISDSPNTKANYPLSIVDQQPSFSKILSQVERIDVPDDQKNRLKVAFAEGYLAANSSESGHKNSRTMKYLKVWLNTHP